MRVAIDIGRVRDFGTGTYTRNLVTTLARLDPDTTYILVGTLADLAELGPLPENFSLLQSDRSRRSLRKDLQLSWKLRRQKVQLLHSPYLAVPWVVPCRHVVTVHDTAEFLDRRADGISLAELLHFERTRYALRRACRILSVSQATRRQLQRLFAVPGEKIEVVYNALDTRLEQAPTPEEVERTLSRYSAHSPYLLYAGNVKPHKNLPRLVEAFALLKDQLRQHPRYADLKLIIIGDELSKHAQLRHAVLKSRTQHDVRFLGFVAPQTLSVFYARASAFVFPSLHEGFGLPPLEAMALGTPVVASKAAALPEVLGDAAVFVNPEKVFDISRGIHRVLLDDDLRQRLIARGHQQVRRFSWDESVRRVLEIYRLAALA
ncbi:MAG: glycosyltransferase family 4 protein [Terriglobia bacterium]